MFLSSAFGPRTSLGWASLRAKQSGGLFGRTLWVLLLHPLSTTKKSPRMGAFLVAGRTLLGENMLLVIFLIIMTLFLVGKRPMVNGALSQTAA